MASARGACHAFTRASTGMAEATPSAFFSYVNGVSTSSCAARRVSLDTEVAVRSMGDRQRVNLSSPSADFSFLSERDRSEERREGEECFSTVRSRGLLYH